MTLRATISSIRIRKKLSEPFDTKRGTVYSKPAILLGYADESLAQPFPNIEKEAKAVGLVVKENKTNYLKATHKDSSRFENYATVDSYKFKKRKDFVSLETSINFNNSLSLYINRRKILPTVAHLTNFISLILFPSYCRAQEHGR